MVSQGCILGPLLSIIFMNDAHGALRQILDLYADDTTLQTSDQDLSVLEQKWNEDLVSLSKWLNEDTLVLNTEKTVCMILGTH